MNVSRHAKERMAERNITIQDVATVLQFGKRLVNRHDDTKYTFIDNTLNVYVVTDKALTCVITVFKKEQ